MSGLFQRRVCVVGSLNMDLVVRTPRFPAAGETILGGSFATFAGGKGANQAVAAARMGVPVSMIGRVGDDNAGADLRRVLEMEGIDASHVSTSPGTPTGVAVITVADGGGNTIVVAPGANALLTPEDIDAGRGCIEGADVLLMQLEVPLVAVQRAAEIASGAGKTVILNAAPARHLPLQLLQLVDLLVVNDTEAAIVSDEYFRHEGAAAAREGAPEESAPPTERRLPLEGVPLREAIVTLGENGAFWKAGAGRTTKYGAYKVDAVDTVGAGDAFCGVLASTWAPLSERQGQFDVLASISNAAAAGALACTRRGAIPSLPRRDELLEFVSLNRMRETPSNETTE